METKNYHGKPKIKYAHRGGFLSELWSAVMHESKTCAHSILKPIVNDRAYNNWVRWWNINGEISLTTKLLPQCISLSPLRMVLLAVVFLRSARTADSWSLSVSRWTTKQQLNIRHAVNIIAVFLSSITCDAFYLSVVLNIVTKLLWATHFELQ